eukprot:TRINITY_DN1129_c0_g1_i1.p1 TRINITY_DN1129_c0_g1~~TRINITY_DN1129_c0_g1_i1.p1  ORF type:complete len:133 (+),score=26.03 TRINITY_DN1129_c0_g1_i1:183-581(+)
MRVENQNARTEMQARIDAANAAAAAAQAAATAVRHRSSSGCFSGSSFVTVETEHGLTSRIKISNLKPGDKVLSMKRNGQIFFDEVFYCSHMHKFTGSEELHVLMRLTCKKRQRSRTFRNSSCLWIYSFHYGL